MAEGGHDYGGGRPKIQQLCRYFMHGACDKGADCRFLHDRTGTAPLNNVCKFYQQGRCTYGKNCRYEHVRVAKSSHSNTNNTQPAQRNQQQRHNSRQSESSGPVTRQRQRGAHSQSTSSDDWEPSMVSLKRGGDNRGSATNKKQPVKSQTYVRNNWARANDFVPGEKFHAGATYAKATNRSDDDHEEDAFKTETDADLLCPYYSHGDCPYGPECNYIHGDLCDVCQLPKLHPTDTTHNEHHRKECLAEMEKDMEHSFALKESANKECCICLDVVLNKEDKASGGLQKSLFGILENCTHCFCLDCIRRWRSDKSFGKNVRVCPICRVHSDFVTPSNLWVEEEEAKKQVIQAYKDKLKTKNCVYFKQGKGHCPFNEKCFYKHAYPDGTIASPKQRRKPRRRVNADGDLSEHGAINLWDFLENRQEGIISLEDELSMFLFGMLGDSDDDDDFNLYWLGAGISDSDTDSDDDFY